MKCKDCGREIWTLMNAEMICFKCFNKRQLGKEQRHNHKAPWRRKQSGIH